MRRMPQLTPGQTSVRMTSAFYGYNHNEIISDGEMYDMQNMCGDMYPLLTPRKKRGITSLEAGTVSVPLTGIHGRDQLVFVRGSQVFYNFEAVQGLELSTDPAFCPKKIVSMGAYVCIWPDKQYFNTVDLTDAGSMERKWHGSGSDVTLAMCRVDGSNYNMEQITVSPDAPADPHGGDLWIDQSGDNDVLRQWGASTEEWIEVATTYVRIACNGIGAGLKEYDCIDLSGLEASDTLDPSDPAAARIRAQVEALNGSFIVYACSESYVVVAGLLSQTQGSLKDQDVRADLTIPDLDYVCESNNRLWGCKYGLVNGQVVNEIRASKLGDFRNWNCFMGISTDSYTASVGTDGPFSGAISQRGYPVFWKDDYIHRVTGQTPGTFAIQTTAARGVQPGCWRSLVVAGENVYYKARNAVMMYDGNMPQPISQKLGEILYSDARGGVLGNKYYLSMKDQHGRWRMFVYDTEHGSWFKEDEVKALGFGAAGDELFYIDEINNTLVTVKGSMGELEEDFDWAAEFDLYGVNYVRESNYDSASRIRNGKYISQFKINMYLEPGTVVRLWMKYNEEAYEYKGEVQGAELKMYTMPVIPKRCNHVRFKLTGKGEARIYNISRIMEVGGDG